MPGLDWQPGPRTEHMSQPQWFGYRPGWTDFSARVIKLLNGDFEVSAFCDTCATGRRETFDSLDDAQTWGATEADALLAEHALGAHRGTATA